MSESIFDSPTTIVDFVANGADSKYFVLGEGLDPVKTDIADIAISIILKDSTIYNGTSKNALGNPWFALREVANDLAERGYPLKAGDVIFSGKVAPAYKMQSDKAKGMYKGVAGSFPDIHVMVK
jgi:2-keto-4-pentenoate hydratase